jgi:DNA-binding transcriptional regulator LsrR (DeoR family)
LLNEEVISHVMREGRNCDIYLMGMGGVRSDAAVRFVPEGAGLLTEDLLTQMARTKGVVGTMCARMYTADGEDCPYPEGNGAIMGISLNDMRRSAANGSYVLVVAGGETRHRAVLGALKTGCVNCIVTDQRCAEWVVEQAEEEGSNILEEN